MQRDVRCKALAFPGEAFREQVQMNLNRSGIPTYAKTVNTRRTKATGLIISGQFSLANLSNFAIIFSELFTNSHQPTYIPTQASASALLIGKPVAL